MLDQILKALGLGPKIDESTVTGGVPVPSVAPGEPLGPFTPNPNAPASGGLPKLVMALVAPILQGLLSNNSEPKVPPISPGPVQFNRGGGQIIGPAFAKTNPVSIRNRGQ